jgi:hypothetical protein
MARLYDLNLTGLIGILIKAYKLISITFTKGFILKDNVAEIKSKLALYLLIAWRIPLVGRF